MGKLYRDQVRKYSKAKGSARALLNILADYATDEGRAWPGRDALANDTGMSERNVTRCLQKLCDDGRLVIEENETGGRGRKPVYKIIFPECEKGDKLSLKRETDCHPLVEERVTNAPIKGDKSAQKGDKSVEIPSYVRSEPQLEPKLEPIKPDGDGARTRMGGVFEVWSRNIPGMMSEILGNKLADLVDECGEPSVVYGIEASIEANARNFKYIAACARNHAAGKSAPTKPQARAPSGGDYRPMSNAANNRQAVANVIEKLKAQVNGHG